MDIADKIFVSADGKKLAEKKSHTISYGKICDPVTGAVIDEVLVMPHAFSQNIYDGRTWWR